MSNPIQGKRIVLGITGSIACYKVADLASKLSQAGAAVDVILTEGARQFLTPLTFQSVTGRRAYTDDDLWGSEAHVLHVGLAHDADLLAIVPATANSLAKLAHGQSDNLLSVTALAATCPLLLAPAMDGGMYSHPATQANLTVLEERGAKIVGPEEGHLASGLVAMGRMSEPAAILGAIRYHLSRSGPLQGIQVVITAGGTREALDPVRFLTNHSSGKQGYALAQAALDAGAEVTLITTSSLPTPVGANVVSINSTQEMAEAVLYATTKADVLLMAAAVADYRPAQIAEQKIKKSDDDLRIDLVRNPDILIQVANQRRQADRPRVVIGFAAETQNLRENAAGKLQRKNLDMIVANDVSAADAGFGVDTNRVFLLERDESEVELPLMTKSEVAQIVIDKVVQFIQ
ncbi:MAG: bifunctional phosphopantothenoylcysteine decarboxylase/phosphopantothenate--cysteine ligase CoaBC [Chloroflexota bacterium]